MSPIQKIVAKVRENPKAGQFKDLSKVCDHYFGEPCTKGSHRIYRMPWQGDPKINIQDDDGQAKPYQVRQVLQAIDKLGGV